MTRKEAKNFEKHKLVFRQSQIPFLRHIDKIYDDFDKEKKDLLRALKDAIERPMGVVPDSAIIFMSNDYICGQDRNEPKAVAHIYEGPFSDPGRPMCARGWNRDNGFGYSIFRNSAKNGICKICLRRLVEGREPVEAKERETKWL